MHLTPPEALSRLNGAEFVELFARHDLTVEIYRPDRVDRQGPHTRDEIYVVVSGTGTFVNGNVRHPFAAGDLLYVPAGVEHRFIEFTRDFVTWVFFFGAERA